MWDEWRRGISHTEESVLYIKKRGNKVMQGMWAI